MRKLLLPGILVLFLACTIPAQAQDSNIDEAVNLSKTPIKDWVDKIPPMKNAITINKDGQIGYAALFRAVEWKGVGVDIGYAPKQALAFGLSYKLANLGEMGVDVPLLKYINIEPGIGMTWDRIDGKDFRDTEESFFAYLSIVDLRFY